MARSGCEAISLRQLIGCWFLRTVTATDTSTQARLTQRDGVLAPPASLALRDSQGGVGMVENETMQATSAIEALPMAALLPFDPQHAQPRAGPFSFVDYIGHAIHPHKRGAILGELPNILGVRS